jgi:hypothetical protein
VAISEREEGAGVIRFVFVRAKRCGSNGQPHGTINTLSAIFRTPLIELVIMSLIKQPLQLICTALPRAILMKNRSTIQISVSLMRLKESGLTFGLVRDSGAGGNFGRVALNFLGSKKRKIRQKKIVRTMKQTDK